jgi:hypothetical protein
MGSNPAPARLFGAELPRLRIFWSCSRLEKFWEIAIAREVGDNVLYHSQSGLESSQEVWGHLFEMAT